MYQHPVPLKTCNQATGARGLSPAKQDLRRARNAEGRHTVMVAATARPQRAYLAVRSAVSICGTKRRCRAQDF